MALIGFVPPLPRDGLGIVIDVIAGHLLYIVFDMLLDVLLNLLVLLLDLFHMLLFLLYLVHLPRPAGAKAMSVGVPTLKP